MTRNDIEFQAIMNDKVVVDLMDRLTTTTDEDAAEILAVSLNERIRAFTQLGDRIEAIQAGKTWDESGDIV